MRSHAFAGIVGGANHPVPASAHASPGMPSSGEGGQAFSLQVEKLRKATAAGSRKEAALSYAAALEALEIYLNDVEV